MDFSTRCWARAWRELLLAWVLICHAGGAALAQSPPAPPAPPAAPLGTEITELQVERAEGELLLSAMVRFELSGLVDDALLKGVPMYFVAEAEVLRERWYWTDKKVASETRYMRLAFQPLTRRWRVNVGPRPISAMGAGVALAQSFDTLAEALASIQRISRWRIVSAADIDGDSSYTLRFRFALDTSQLPRPLQIGAVGQSEWNVSAGRTVRLGPEGGK